MRTIRKNIGNLRERVSHLMRHRRPMTVELRRRLRNASRRLDRYRAEGNTTLAQVTLDERADLAAELARRRLERIAERVDLAAELAKRALERIEVNEHGR